MTYSLNTLNADRTSAGPTGVSRFAQEIGLVLGIDPDTVIGEEIPSLTRHTEKSESFATV